MFSSIRSRLWLSYAALIAVALTFVGLVLLVFLLRNPATYRDTYIRLRAAETVAGSRPISSANLSAVATGFGVRLLHFDAGGRLLEDSNGGTADLRMPTGVLGLRALASARDIAGRVWFFTRVRLADGSWLVAATPRPRLLPAIGVLSDELWRPLLQGGVIALLLSLMLAYLLARWIGDPLQALVTVAHQISTGSGHSKNGVPSADPNAQRLESVRLPPERGPQEVRELTRAFNSMAERVLASQHAQREFVANVSHEMKTPLTSIQGFAQALLDGAAASPEARQQAATVIHDEAGRMHRLAVDLLELARFDSGVLELKRETVNLSTILTGVVQKLSPIAVEKGVDLEVEPGQGFPTLQADGDRLSQVLNNILDNAIKHTPSGGRVTLRAVQIDSEIAIVVRDSGNGIAASDLPHVFERFYQADVSRRGGDDHGVGLGLAIAKEIVEAHGGKISVRSGPNQGAEFTVRLPIAYRPRG